MTEGRMCRGLSRLTPASNDQANHARWSSRLRRQIPRGHAGSILLFADPANSTLADDRAPLCQPPLSEVGRHSKPMRSR